MEKSEFNGQLGYRLIRLRTAPETLPVASVLP